MPTVHDVIALAADGLRAHWPRMLAIRAARGWDPVAGAIEGPVTVRVSPADGAIQSVDRGRSELPVDHRVIELGDAATLLPGMVDCHSHLCWDPFSDPVEQFRGRDDAALIEQARRAASQALAAGITTIRDLGDRGFVTLDWRDELARDRWLYPEILVAGPPITPPRGHCWFLGGETLPGDVERAVEARANRGVDVIKIMATGGKITPGSAAHESQYDRTTLERVARAAMQRSLPVTAHAHGGSGIRDSVAAGIGGIEHCTFLTADDVECDWDLVDEMAAAGTHVSATVAWLPSEEPFPPLMARQLEKACGNLARMHSAGVRLSISSDAGIAPRKPHDALPHGAVLVAGLGLRNHDALVAVTAAPAAACGLEHRKARLASGYDADLLAVAGDPTRDIAALLRPIQVFRKGRPALPPRER